MTTARQTRTFSLLLATGLAVCAAAAAPAAAAASAADLSAAPAAAAARGTVYVVQGVVASTLSLRIDGRTIAAAAAAKTIVGPLSLTAGRHTLTALDPAAGIPVQATIDVTAGSDTDAVVHRDVDPAQPPVITTYANDLTPVAAGSARLAVAHTAAVGPADIRVRGKVLFANVANGESLTLTVPGGTYPVDIVPAATTGPVVLGPVNLPVKARSLTRVFAIGVAATGSMDAVVQVLPLKARGSGTAPTNVAAGGGGQAEALLSGRSDDGIQARDALGLGLVGLALVLFGVGWRRRRTAVS